VQDHLALIIFVANEYYGRMSRPPLNSIRPAKPSRLLEEEAALAIIRTADLLMQNVAGLLKPHALSPTQYNVLRILRGAPGGISAKEIAGRLITRDPDVTRLVDRLEKRGLLVRDRGDTDRRVVIHRLTADGLDLVNALDRPIQRMHRAIMRRLSPDRVKALNAILEEIRIEL
jgi:DNA-binding MarR family transcriptional regulator